MEWLQGLQGGAATFVGALTGSAAGLIALVLGALFNAHLNRKRDDELRRSETRSIAAALRAELSSLEDTLLSNAVDLDKSQDDFFLPDLSHSVRILPSVLGKLGLLDVETIKEVVQAYIVVEQYCENLLIMGGQMRTDIPTHRRLIFMPVIRAKSVAKMNRQIAERVTNAKQLLIKYLT